MIVEPRKTPDRDSKYMGLAWIQAGFSKDPSTQVGAMIVSHDNYPLSSGYNGPPRKLKDNLSIWTRPSNEARDELSKYDLVTHAEANAIRHARSADLRNSTIYVTAMPCPSCMLRLIEEEIGRIVYFDFQSSSGSMLQNNSNRSKTLKMAEMAEILIEPFSGDLSWLENWQSIIKEKGVFKTAHK